MVIFLNNFTPLIIFKKLFICLFLATLGLRCCAQAFSSCGAWAFSSCGARAFYSCSEQGLLLFVAVGGLLIAVASPVAEHGL